MLIIGADREDVDVWNSFCKSVKQQLFNNLQIAKRFNMFNLIKIVVISAMPLTFFNGLTSNTETTPTNNIVFHTGSFESAKSKASQEGKLFFVEFYADWCTPCKWMDKTTFKDVGVIDLLNNNYVPLKLDIESTEGTDLKQKFEVRMLPTILIFNSQGRMVDRVEKL